MDGSDKISPDVPAQVRGKRRSELTQQAFDRFLECLSPDRDQAGTRYLEIHRKLERFFEWRGCPAPQEHADEAITRTAQRIGQGDDIKDAATFVFGVARMLLLEIRKESEKKQQLAVEDAEVPSAPATESRDLEARAECLRRCLEKLPPGNREMILLYYEGEKRTKIDNRKLLTEKLQVSVSTLRMRALRIREQLMACVETGISQAGL